MMLNSYIRGLTITRAFTALLLSIFLTGTALALNTDEVSPPIKQDSITVRSDQRITIRIFTSYHFGQRYTIYALDIDPKRWTPNSLGTDLDIFERHFADVLLRSTHKFLANVHMSNPSHAEGNPVNLMILKSFEKASDPFGRMEWTNAAKSMHKVDDYFDHKNLILVVAKGDSIRPEDILGTIKFVQSSPERLLAPILGDFKGFLPPTIVETQASTVEYENLARAANGPSPVPLLLKYAVDSSFFKGLIKWNPNLSVILNAEDDKVPFHQRFSFEILPEYYRGLKAKRMSARFSSFADKVHLEYDQRMAKATHTSKDPLSLESLVPFDWNQHLDSENIWSQLEQINSLRVPFLSVSEATSCPHFYSKANPRP